MGTGNGKALCGTSPPSPPMIHSGRGVPGLKEYLLSQATPGRWTLEAGMSTDRSAEDLALEIVREKIFQRFYDGALEARA